MSNKLAMLVAVAVLAGGAARADGPDPIAMRQAGQDLLAGDFAGIRALVAAKGDVKTLELPAKAMARWMTLFPGLFPPGSDKGDTKALPAVWTDPAGFHKAAEDFVAAASKLSELAKAGDADGVAAQIKPVGDACGACHRTYRAR
jgi:cytochrome c556